MSNLSVVPFSEMQQMADSIAKSGLFGLGNSHQVLALMAVAQAEGLHPATAARDYHIIQGRPALKADAMLARFQQSGGKVEWKEYTDKKASAVFSHPSGGTIDLSWTIEQAKSAGLVKEKSGWEKFPRAMLRARLISEGIRTVYPGCIIGTYTPEEVSDFESPAIKDMGPAQFISVPEITMSDLLEEDNEDFSFKLLLPNGDVYSKHKTEEEWTYSYINMITRIRESEKYTEEEKKEKLKAYIKANEKNRKSMPKELKLKIALIMQPNELNPDHD